jgi:fructokinase
MAPASRTILSFGETLWDLLPTGPMLGGAPFNLAYRLTSLGDAGLIVTRVGRDEHGQRAALEIAELGMDTSFIQWDDRRPTGTVEVRVDDRGDPDFTILADVAYDEIEVTYDLLELAQRADCICFGTLAQRNPVSALSLSRLLNVAGPKPRFLDINLRKDCYTWQTITGSLDQAGLVKMNADEARRLAFGFDLGDRSLPDFCAALLERCSLAVCIVTLGERGALAVSDDGQTVYVPGFVVPVIDTCGSGDAFSAGFLHSYLEGRPLAECCRLGNALGALVAAQPGATTPVPAAAIEQLLGSNAPRTREPSLVPFESS